MPEPPIMPPRVAKLPRDSVGRPVPVFAAWVDGKPDFRVIDPKALVRCHVHRRCWICGEPLGANVAFVVGPLCAVNRVSAEPPEHTDCAVYSARACPFLTNPRKFRRAANLPAGTAKPAGIMLERNPGVTLVWVCRTWRLDGLGDMTNAPLVRMGEPTETHWYCEGRAATRPEVLDALESGLPILREMAAEDGPRAERELARLEATARTLVPA